MATAPTWRDSRGVGGGESLIRSGAEMQQNAFSNASKALESFAKNRQEVHQNKMDQIDTQSDIQGAVRGIEGLYIRGSQMETVHNMRNVLGQELAGKQEAFIGAQTDLENSQQQFQQQQLQTQQQMESQQFNWEQEDEALEQYRARTAEEIEKSVADPKRKQRLLFELGEDYNSKLAQNREGRKGALRNFQLAQEQSAVAFQQNFIEKQRNLQGLGRDLQVTQGNYDNTENLDTYLSSSTNEAGVYGDLGQSAPLAQGGGQQPGFLGSYATGGGQPQQQNVGYGTRSNYVDQGQGKHIPLSQLGGVPTDSTPLIDMSEHAQKGEKLLENAYSQFNSVHQGEGGTTAPVEVSAEDAIAQVRDMDFSVESMINTDPSVFAYNTHSIKTRVEQSLGNESSELGDPEEWIKAGGRDKDFPTVKKMLIENGTLDPEKANADLRSDLNYIRRQIKKESGNDITDEQAALVMSQIAKKSNAIFLGGRIDKSMLKAAATEIGSGTIGEKVANKKKYKKQIEGMNAGYFQINDSMTKIRARKLELEQLAYQKNWTKETLERNTKLDTQLKKYEKEFAKGVNQYEGAMQAIQNEPAHGMRADLSPQESESEYEPLVKTPESNVYKPKGIIDGLSELIGNRESYGGMGIVPNQPIKDLDKLQYSQAQTNKNPELQGLDPEKVAVEFLGGGSKDRLEALKKSLPKADYKRLVNETTSVLATREISPEELANQLSNQLSNVGQLGQLVGNFLDSLRYDNSKEDRERQQMEEEKMRQQQLGRDWQLSEFAR